MRTLESSDDHIFEAWPSNGRFTKNPDMVVLPNGKLLAVYTDADKHWAESMIYLTIIESNDRGKTWSNPRVLIQSDRSKREPHWLTPRINLLSDGRLAVLCDIDDFEYAHEYQNPEGIWIWWSDDYGETWSDPQLTGIPGIEPDQVVELQNGRLAIGTELILGDTQKIAQLVSLSDDGGKTWGKPIIVAKDSVHDYNEGSIVLLNDDSIVCVMRDNLHNNYPSYIAFSYDNADSWSAPVEAPFSGDRPYSGQLSDGRLFVTYRNKGGNPGTYGWIGDIHGELRYQCSALRSGPSEITLDEADGLHIVHNDPATTQYNLLPPENFRSEMTWESELKVQGDVHDQQCAIIQIGRFHVTGSGQGVLRLTIRPDGLYVGSVHHMSVSIDRFWSCDMTDWHKIRIHHKGGLLQFYLDGKCVLRHQVVREAPLAPTYFGTPPNSVGQSWWRNVTYQVTNSSEADHFWKWDMNGGTFPDQYEIDNIIELHANHHESPDNGYSTWHQFDDGEILVLDYTNNGDPLGQAHLVSCRLKVQDLSSIGRRSQ